ncbi:MAG: hypothetical protein GC154_10955 [bacterium]|nr:hypothetical protein [bacterium]
MPPTSPGRTDLLIHLFAFLLQAGLLVLTGVASTGTTPPWAFTVYLILAALSVIRAHEAAARFETRLILIPAVVGSAIVGFCLIIDMPAMFWGFMVPRQLPVWVRLIWMQTALLALHPGFAAWFAARVHRAAEAIRSWGCLSPLTWATALAAGLALWLIHSQNVSSDGYDWLRYSLVPRQWALYLREPLGTLIFRLAVLAGQKWFHWDPYISISLLTIVCGILTVMLLSRVIAWFVEPAFAAPSLLLIAASCGFTQVFAGNIEIYALLQLGLAAYLFCAMKYVRGEWSAWAPGLAFGLLFCTHLSAGWWAPAFLLLPALRYKTSGGSPARDFAAMAAASAAPVIALALFLLEYRYGGNPSEMIAHFFSDQVMNVGTDAAMFHNIVEYLSPEYWLMQLNVYFYLVAPAFLLIPFLLAAFRSWRALQPRHVWLALMAAFYLAYSVVWRADRPYPSDWDLFSGLAVPLVLTLCSVASRLKVKTDALRLAFAQMAGFSLTYVFLQLLRNHLKATDWPLFM